MCRLLVCGFALVFVLNAPATGSLTAQQDTGVTTEPVQTIHAETNLVVLDLVVHDRHGRSVSGLKREDFTVLEEGKPQVISSFEASSTGAALPEKARIDNSGHPDWGSAPLTILVIDELTTSFTAMAYARFELEQYLKRQPALLDTPAELLAVNDYGFQEIEPYTRDRDVLLKHLKERRVGLPSALFRDDREKLVAGTFTALKQIALASAGEKDERKNLIWIGTGFPSVHYFFLSERRSKMVQALVRDTTTSLLQARIVVYVIDPEGLAAYSTERVGPGDERVFTAIGLAGPHHFSSSYADEITLDTFASQTGGKYVFNRNDVDVAVGSSIDDLRYSYALSYTPMNLARDGKYRRIRLKMNRPGLTVQTRGGYFAPGGDVVTQPENEVDFELATAASNSMYYSGVGASITSLKPGKTSGTVAIVVRVALKGLQWSFQPDGSARATLIVAAVAQSAERKMLKSHVRREVVTVSSSQVDQIPGRSIDIGTNLPMLEKALYLRVLVRDSNGHLGSADADPGSLASLRVKVLADSPQAGPVR